MEELIALGLSKNVQLLWLLESKQFCTCKQSGLIIFGLSKAVCQSGFNLHIPPTKNEFLLQFHNFLAHWFVFLAYAARVSTLHGTECRGNLKYSPCEPCKKGGRVLNVHNLHPENGT